MPNHPAAPDSGRIAPTRTVGTAGFGGAAGVAGVVGVLGPKSWAPAVEATSRRTAASNRDTRGMTGELYREPDAPEGSLGRLPSGGESSR